jgi:hypothetical protein
MKEIDFLPEWYKGGRRRQLSYRTQYIALGGIFVVMIVWNLLAAHSISKAKAMSIKMLVGQANAEQMSVQLNDFKNYLREFQIKAESIDRIDSKIDVASVLAEISFLVNEKIVLSEVEFTAEKFVDRPESKTSSNTAAVVRAIPAKFNQDKELPLGDVKFKVVIGGVAADASDIGALICRLEDSPYFCQVVPSFSRNIDFKKISGYSASPRTDVAARLPDIERRDRKTENEMQISEFEISCYLANFREQ